MALKSSNKKTKVWYKVLAVLLLAGILAFVWWFMWGNFWKITNIEIVNAKHTDTNALRQDIDLILQQKKFFIIPNNHIIFLSENMLKKHILETYPSVESVEITKNKDRDLIISILDRKPMGVWCDENCFFFDDQGIAFKSSFNFTGAVFATWVQDTPTALKFYDTVPCISLCIGKDFVTFLSQNKIKKVSMNNGDLKMFSEYGFYIKAIDNSTTTMRNMNLFAKDYKGDWKSLQYVDIRFGDKIFYK